MRRSSAVRIAVLFALYVAVSMPVFAASRPWYAERLEKLGFFVFDEPFAFADFSVETIAGAKQARSSSKGNIVLLNFWATWCPPCKEEMPSIESLSAAMKGRKFEVMAVNLGDSAGTVKDFLKQYKYSFPIYLDQQKKLARAYASKGIPTSYIIDKSGKFIAGVIGSLRYDTPEVISLLSELAAK